MSQKYRQIAVTFPQHSYAVHIGAGALGSIAQIVRERAPHRKAALLADKNVAELYGTALTAALTASGYEVVFHAFDSGEERKNSATAAELYTQLIESHLERKSPVIALGGGVAGDLVGFVAATYLRGVPFFQVPTTLLAMVDASVGGKVGYNLPQGKNLVGAFYQPEAVCIDPAVLSTLADREYRCGLAECVKHAILADAELFTWTEAQLPKILAKDPATLAELIARNVQIKADIVMADEKESGIRAHLNLGHTFGHAIEATSGYGTYLHGEAVSLGLCAAAKVAASRGLCGEEVLSRTVQILDSIGLPVRAKLAGTEMLNHAMLADKKVKDGAIRLILPTAIGSVAVVSDATEKELGAAWQSIRA